jgi:plasmid stabilization system protein ParE
MRNYKVLVSPKAREMLDEHIDFLAQVNKASARNKKNEIMKALRSLSDMPARFPLFESDYIKSGKYHKMYIEKWYLVLYQIIDDTVYVEYIIDCRENYSWLLR